MSEECRVQLQRRQKLAAENYKVSRGLVKACKEEIKINKCKKQLHNENKTVRLAEILLCLEGKIIYNTISIFTSFCLSILPVTQSCSFISKFHQ